MALFTRDSIDRLRDAIDMVDLVGRKTDLRRVGSRWTGLCPFHDERSPSFSVNAEEKLFYCFGCQAKGDAFGFVEQSEGLDFRESVERLADLYGVELQPENDDLQAESAPAASRAPDQAARPHRELLREVLLGLAGGRQGARVPDRARARRGGAARVPGGLLAERGIVIGAQRDGFRPPSWWRPGWPSAREGGGSTTASAGASCSRWRTRAGACSARRAGDGGGRGPKYLNTSENEIFHKGRQLFGIDLGQAHAAKSGRIVVVEGWHRRAGAPPGGIRESVAIMGTALTAEQMAELGGPRRWWCWRSTPTARGRRRCCAPRGGAGPRR